MRSGGVKHSTVPAVFYMVQTGLLCAADQLRGSLAAFLLSRFCKPHTLPRLSPASAAFNTGITLCLRPFPLLRVPSGD